MMISLCVIDAQTAVQEADVTLTVVDVRKGLTPSEVPLFAADSHYAKKGALVLNKAREQIALLHGGGGGCESLCVHWPCAFD